MAVALPLMMGSGACAGIVTFESLPLLDPGSNQGYSVTQPIDGFSFTSIGPYPGTRYNGTTGWASYSVNSWFEQIPACVVGVRGAVALFSGWYAQEGPTYCVSRSDGTRWSFDGAYFTAMYGPGIIHLVGLRDGVEVMNFTQGISTTQQTFVAPSGAPDVPVLIDTLRITNDLGDPRRGARLFIMDDMAYTLPAPSCLALLPMCVAASDRRRRR